MAHEDDSEDVTEFLKRIKELGDQRDREDAERTKKLEDDILQGRKERQARREGQCPTPCVIFVCEAKKGITTIHADNHAIRTREITFPD